MKLKCSPRTRYLNSYDESFDIVKCNIKISVHHDFIAVSLRFKCFTIFDWKTAKILHDTYLLQNCCSWIQLIWTDGFLNFVTCFKYEKLKRFFNPQIGKQLYSILPYNFSFSLSLRKNHIPSLSLFVTYSPFVAFPYSFYLLHCFLY